MSAIAAAPGMLRAFIETSTASAQRRLYAVTFGPFGSSNGYEGKRAQAWRWLNAAVLFTSSFPPSTAWRMPARRCRFHSPPTCPSTSYPRRAGWWAWAWHGRPNGSEPGSSRSRWRVRLVFGLVNHFGLPGPIMSPTSIRSGAVVRDHRGSPRDDRGARFGPGDTRDQGRKCRVRRRLGRSCRPGSARP